MNVRVKVIAACSSGLMMCGISLYAQTGGQRATVVGSRVISGVVISGKTGQPLEDAAVTLTNAINGKQESETITGSDGRFLFAGLQDGRFDVRASHRGYVASAYQEHFGVSTAIITGKDLVSTGIPLQLEAQAVISGVATEDSGDPVPNARLSLYSTAKTTGTGKLEKVGDATADAMGNFELAHLAAGGYYLCASGSPWYAYNPQQKNTQHSALDVAYHTSCYPNTTDTKSAELLTVGAGDHITANIALHASPAVRISIQIPAPDKEHPLQMPTLREDIFGSMEQAVVDNSYVLNNDKQSNPPVAMVEYLGVAPGQYQIEVPGVGGASKYANVDASMDHVTLNSASISEGGVSGNIMLAGGGHTQEKFTLILEPVQGGIESTTEIKTDGSFRMSSVPPGEYNVIVATENAVLNVTGLKASGALLNGRIIKIGNDPVSLLVAASGSDSIVTGYVESQGKPKLGVFLVLFPVDAGASKEALRPNQSDSDGSFYFPHVFPGNYVLVAIEEGWTLDWAKPDVLNKYLPHGININVPYGANEIKVSEKVEMQGK